MIDAMPRPHLPHLQREKTRHGKVIYYVRLNRETPRVRINGPYGSDQFMTEYRAAIAGEPVQTAKIRVSKASLQWLADQWRESSDWFMKATATKRQRENILANILSENGRLPGSFPTAKPYQPLAGMCGKKLHVECKGRI